MEGTGRDEEDEEDWRRQAGMKEQTGMDEEDEQGWRGWSNGVLGGSGCCRVGEPPQGAPSPMPIPDTPRQPLADVHPDPGPRHPRGAPQRPR